jgi:hypothetical protein
MKFHLDTAERDFRRFWNMIDAEGDLDAALNEWDRHYGASQSESSTELRNEGLFLRALLKVGRVVTKFPRFLNEA